MKQINKATLDELIRLTRKYVKTGDTDLLDARINTGKELSAQTFGKDCYWSSLGNIVYSIIGTYPLMPRATNADIYRVFEAMRFKVVEDKPEQEAANET